MNKKNKIIKRICKYTRHIKYYIDENERYKRRWNQPIGILEYEVYIEKLNSKIILLKEIK